ncbi:nucleotide pyrophosphohydrolase [Bacillus thuringiensis]|uniref:nucleotide pyrophosphohydrolase n=1 Tax=Bacillus cereus group TaxID=86661 RepID=UPI0010BDB96E|nr:MULTISPECIES: nucleotide pyrophosphohydrolase [Bacillus cereus group]MCC2505651.1 nucleotide pyrophosphohydrolase [Bacillus cereus]TKH63562.1 nucleotide pyrophosphohydrolase [Bacillus cereus]
MNQTILEKVLKFRDDRNWKQFHNPKDLVISLSLEASELLENFQWKSSEEAVETKKEDMKDELADQLDIDLEEIIINKIEKNNKKYPVEKSRDSKKKYNEILKRWN